MADKEIKRIARKIAREVKTDQKTKIKGSESDESLKLDNIMKILEEKRTNGEI